jgi:hypothetical protein
MAHDEKEVPAYARLREFLGHSSPRVLGAVRDSSIALRRAHPRIMMRAVRSNILTGRRPRLSLKYFQHDNRHVKVSAAHAAECFALKLKLFEARRR